MKKKSINDKRSLFVQIIPSIQSSLNTKAEEKTKQIDCLINVWNSHQLQMKMTIKTMRMRNDKELFHIRIDVFYSN
jgi:hypothetical protein